MSFCFIIYFDMIKNYLIVLILNIAFKTNFNSGQFKKDELNNIRKSRYNFNCLFIYSKYLY